MISRTLIMTALLSMLSFVMLNAQKTELSYYLPEIDYNPDIPTPEEFLGFQVGDWHASHDQVVFYMRKLAEVSDRIIYSEYARSHENRPLILLKISSPENLVNIDNIKQEHAALCDPDVKQPEIKDMPAIIYQGFSVHGNEPSGGNAAILVAYYLAAGQSEEVNQLLEDVVILFDPVYNPDGFNRFASWANVHKAKNINPDPNDREYGEAWPRGRTNHYWFDLNRDWIFLTHPESQGRMEKFHEWKPNILTDHHEMGTNSTFFFQPGIPTRVHPLTPARNQELTQEIGNFHAETLDEIASLYYSRESYDDYYYGKGSAFPDINGGIGILFEQASSRGHAQESDNGILTFPFTIRNQVRTALSTQKAAVNLRIPLLEHQRTFYESASDKAKDDPVKAYVFSSGNDITKSNRFIDIMLTHQIKIHKLNGNVTADNITFDKKDSYIVPLNQKEYSVAKTIFDKVTTFEDSLFYDVSTWNLPLSFDLEYSPLSSGEFSNNLLGDLVTETAAPMGKVVGPVASYAYIFDWNDYLAPQVLNKVLQKGLRTKVLNDPITVQTSDGNKVFGRGAIMVSVQNQALTSSEIHDYYTEITKHNNVVVYALSSGTPVSGNDLGSGTLAVLRAPEVMMFVGDGINSNDAGEIWHLMDTRYDIKLTKLDISNFRASQLSRYNVIIMPDGSYNSLGKSGAEALSAWVSNGGSLICYKRAIDWAAANSLVSIERVKSEEDKKTPERAPYERASADSGRNLIGGALFNTKLDLSHPINYGVGNDHLASFKRGTAFYELPKNAYASPAVYTENPLLSGYITPENLKKLSGTAAIVVGGKGSGRVICFADNTNFRGYTYGTNKLLANAIFFGNTISGGTIAR